MTKGQLIFAILAMMLVVTAFPVVSAFEGAKVNVSASETIPATKVIRLATCDEITYAKDILGADIPCAANPEGVTEWDYIPARTCVVWVVTLGVMNPLDYTMTKVIVRDQFNANVGIAVMNGTGTVTPPNQLSEWNIGNMAPGDEACLELIVWTRDTGADAESQQQFADAGTYNLNYSGIMMTWDDSQLKEQSYLYGGPPLTVTVYESVP